MDSKELLEAQYINRQPRADEATSELDASNSPFYYCANCELVYLEADTHDYYAPGFPTLTSARGCPTCADKLRRIDEDDIDCEIFDYFA